MGKKGDALRAAKSQVTYSYTAAQIAEIKKQAILSARKRLIEETDARIGLSAMTDTLALLLAVPVTVLCRDFGWKPIGDTPDKRNRLSRYVDCLIRELDQVMEDQDILGYCDRCQELYGVKFVSEVMNKDDKAGS